MEYTVNVKPHLKKFIPKYLNTSEPIKIESNNVIGKIFIAVSNVHPDTKNKFLEKEYPCEMRFVLNKDISRLRPKKKDVNKINVFMDKLFKEIMYQWVLASMELGNSSSEGLRKFLAYYKISEDDYSWNNAHRAWMRYYLHEYEKSCPLVS